jgi:NAD(P)-dependent dehydrogenase (short-subunit alcohol dehydrogenase family)
MRIGALDEITAAEWQDLVQTNVTGTMMAIRAFVSLMSNDARIVTIASTAGTRPIPRFAAYSTTKAAVIHLTQAAALDYADRGIRVNCVCLGPMDPSASDHGDWMEGAMLRDHMIAATPLGYLGTPSDAAHLVSFLVDSASHWMTGAVLTGDGGLSLV